VSSDLFGGRGFSTIFGSIHISLGLGTAVGAWAGGKVFDLTGSYTVAMWGAAALACFSCALLWVVAPRRPNPPPRGNKPLTNSHCPTVERNASERTG
jgi:nitrate/nitrite transporter NarK